MTKKKVSKKATRASSRPVVPMPTRVIDLDIMDKDVKSLLKRIAVLEKRQQIITDGFAFMAENCRQMFGLSGLAQIIDAITAKFK